MASLTMEGTFIVTEIAVVVIGVILGLVTYWLFERDNKENDE